MLLAGDVGGTKTLLGLFERADRRPTTHIVRAYTTAQFDDFSAVLDAFIHDAPTSTIEAVALGVAGPVDGSLARLTNAPWEISADDVARRAGAARVHLLNDLEAMACSVEVLDGDEIETLHDRPARPDGHAVVIAAGTGLGQAYLHRVGGRLVPVASEGGHADFAARTDREMEFARMLRDRYGRAEIEQVLSGPGLLNLHRFTHRGGRCDIVDPGDESAARVSQAGLTGRCQHCADALQMFVSAYGAESGNLALRGLATAGVYIGGGIAPKILPLLRTRLFLDAFLDKPPLADLVAAMPVKVILNPDAALIGAAVRAQQIAEE